MTKAAAVVRRVGESRPPAAHARASPRPGWVYEVVVAVLADADQPLRPQEVIQRVKRDLGHRVAASSVRNCLLRASTRPDDVIERIAYGSYRRRRNAGG